MRHRSPQVRAALWVGGLLIGCATRTAHTPSPAADARAAARYTTVARGPAVTGELGTAELHTLVQQAAQSVGASLTGDARLAALSAQDAVDPWRAEQLGLPELPAELHTLQAESLAALAAALHAQLPGWLQGAGFTHYGAHLSLGTAGPTLRLALSRRPFRLEPLARQLPAPARVRVRGELTAHRDAELEHVSPSGARRRLTAGGGARFDVQLELASAGAHEVELLGLGAQGRQLLARLRLHAGVAPAPPRTADADPSQPEVEPAALRRALLAAVDAERRSRGLPGLRPHAGLDALCERHATQWLRARHDGRPLQQVTSASERARQAGFAGGSARQFVGHGHDPTALGRALFAEAAARSALLSSEVTHLGLGVVRDPVGRDWAVAGLAVALAQAVDPGRAPQELLARWNAARRARGAGALSLDDALSQAASQHASAFFAPPLPSQDQLVEAVTRSLDTASLRYRRTEALVVVARSLEEASALEPVLAGDVQAVGIGVVQGDRPDTGPRSLAVVIVLGWPR